KLVNIVAFLDFKTRMSFGLLRCKLQLFTELYWPFLRLLLTGPGFFFDLQGDSRVNKGLVVDMHHKCVMTKF
ncbi:MAG: hypothetical protein ACRC9V_02085, partial [Aeromonas sp.]